MSSPHSRRFACILLLVLGLTLMAACKSRRHERLVSGKGICEVYFDCNGALFLAQFEMDITYQIGGGGGSTSANIISPVFVAQRSDEGLLRGTTPSGKFEHGKAYLVNGKGAPMLLGSPAILNATMAGQVSQGTCGALLARRMFEDPQSQLSRQLLSATGAP